MSIGFFNVPSPKNEPVFSYEPGTPEREKLQETIKELLSVQVDIPMYIGGDHVKSGKKVSIKPPHNHRHSLGYFYRSEKTHIRQAIQAAVRAKPAWENMKWEQRISVFLKAADLLTGPYRYKMNAATMLAQSKNVFQAEIDSVCELADFWRFNAYYLSQIYSGQPDSSPGMWNRLEYRPLEGFVFALTPFNFTSIAGNLPTAPAMAGNVVVWKPANSQVYSAQVIMQVLREAGLPDGVINLIYPSGSEAAEVVFSHSDFAGIHFTGSTSVFQSIWKSIAESIHLYRSYPRIVGETGGKDFIVAHESANTGALATAITRGAFEFQGQKCSAASRVYIPRTLWNDVRKRLIEDLASIRMGSPEDFSNFMNAVIDEEAFDKISSYVAQAKRSKDAQIVFGGGCDKSKGYFIEPTVILTRKSDYFTMCEEIFGPVVTVYLYEPAEWKKTLSLVDKTSPYALTGSIFAVDRYAIEEATHRLRHCAGNFYINDKPTGAVVGQQPFGGARASGTNDKAGSMLNLLRWLSPRTIKETFVPPVNYRYPFMEKDK